MSDLFYYEPIKGPGAERRDELGNFAPYRSQPHRGCDWGFSKGSQGKTIFAIRSGKVTFSGWNDALGHTVIIKSADGVYVEYNHMNEKSPLKVGEVVNGGKSVVGRIGCTGSSLSASKAYHLHASAAKFHTPHAAPRPKLIDLFKEIDKSKKKRVAAKATVVAAKAGKVASLAKAAEVKAAKAPAKKAPAKTIASTYTVKRGDSYWAIAQKHKMDYKVLQKLNDNKPLVPGQVLKLK